MPDTGNGGTLTFGTSGFTAQYITIGAFEQEREVLDDSHLGTTGNATKQPGDLVEPGSFDCEIWYDPDEQPPISAVPETITKTYPLPSGQSTPANTAGSGFVSKWGDAELQNNGLMRANMTVQWDGKTGPTCTDSA